MVISNSTTVRSRPPIRYFTQSGIVGWGDAGGGRGGGDDEDDEDGDGEDEDGGDDSFGGDGDGEDDSSGDDDSDGGDSVVKAPIALQALQVLELPALTFQ